MRCKASPPRALTLTTQFSGLAVTSCCSQARAHAHATACIPALLCYCSHAPRLSTACTLSTYEDVHVVQRQPRTVSHTSALGCGMLSLTGLSGARTRPGRGPETGRNASCVCAELSLAQLSVRQSAEQTVDGRGYVAHSTPTPVAREARPSLLARPV